MNKELEEYLNHVAAKGRAQSTLDNYRTSLEDFLNFVNKSVDKIEINDVNEFVSSLRKNYKLSSIEQVKGYIKSFFRFHNRSEIAKQIVLIKIPRRHPEVLSKEELLKRIEKISDPKYKAICMLLYGSGLNKAELINLKKSDLKWSPTNQILVSTKAGEPRWTFFLPEVQKWIENYWKYRTDNSEYVFVENDGKKLSPYKVWYYVKKHLGINPKSVRYAFATHLHQEGGSILAVKGLLGHKNIESTEIYVQIAPVMADAMRFHPLYSPDSLEISKAMDEASGFISERMMTLENLLSKAITKKGVIPEGLIGPKIGQFSRIITQDENKHKEIIQKLNELNKMRVAFQHGEREFREDEGIVFIKKEGFSFQLTTKKEKFSVENFKNCAQKNYEKIFNYLLNFN
jgi:integrase/recombinase XerC